MGRTQTEKYCRRCEQRKPIGHFGERRYRNQVRDTYCLECRAKVNEALEAKEFGIFGRTPEFEEGVRLRTEAIRRQKQLTEGEPHRPHHWTVPVVRIGRR
jgi:hypothetical protein